MVVCWFKKNFSLEGSDWACCKFYGFFVDSQVKEGDFLVVMVEGDCNVWDQGVEVLFKFLELGYGARPEEEGIIQESKVEFRGDMETMLEFLVEIQ